MKQETIIIDADFCIKVGGSSKYPYLEKVLPEIAEKVYVHKYVYEEEILTPASAKAQLEALKKQGILEVISEDGLSKEARKVYNGTYNMLAKVMLNSNEPRKNQGEVRSLSMAKAKAIPYFVTDEKDLQPIIDEKLNNGIEDEDILCIRIEDIIAKIKNNEIQGFSRKAAKVLWVLAGKNKEDFDNSIWPA